MEHTQRALVGGQDGDIILSDSIPWPPELEESQLGVDVKAISLNPVDTKMVGSYFTPGAISGCEFAGVVTGIGGAVAEKRGLKVGDRVAGVVMGMNPLRPHIGAFAEHTACYAYATWKIPDDWTFAQAASGVGGVAWATVPWALFHRLALPPGPNLEPLNSEFPRPESSGPKISITTSHDAGDKPPTTVLVSGGASFTGTCAVQLLKLAGFRVIATCSPRSFDLVKSFGADAVFDYASPTCAAEIKAYTRNSLRLVIDCITTPDTTRLCYEALGRSGGRYVALDPYSMAVAGTRSVVKADWVFGMDLLGEDVAWPAPHGRSADPVAIRFGILWNKTLQTLLNSGQILTHPQQVRDTGLAGALEGIFEIRSAKGLPYKLVYTL
jgi:NADPH:quinone reductase-like Zn-dependent oxidoreductase